MAYVHRNPTLSPTLQWKEMVSKKGDSRGRFPEALRKGMQAAKDGTTIDMGKWETKWLRKPKP